MNKKINLILDIDETLVHTFNFNFSNNQTTEIETSEHSKIGLINLPNYLAIVFLRPYLVEFLNYCFENFNVSFWTAGSSLYCREILKLILTNDQYNKTKIILARETNDYIDLKTNVVYYDITDLPIQKPLDLLWNDLTLKDTFKPENTLIIDDNENIILQNPLNTIHISPFNKEKKNDIILCQLSNWLEIIKEMEDIRPINKNILKFPEDCSNIEVN